MKLILFILLSLFFLGNAVANGNVLLAYLIRRQTGSMIPLLGGLAGLGATLIAPWQWVHHLWYVPLLIDAGTIYWLIMFFVPRRK